MEEGHEGGGGWTEDKIPASVHGVVRGTRVGDPLRADRRGQSQGAEGLSQSRLVPSSGPGRRLAGVHRRSPLPPPPPLGQVGG